MSVRALLLAIAVCATAHACAQSSATDTRALLAASQVEKNDTVRVDLLCALSEAYLRIGEYDHAHSTGQEALMLAERIGWADGRAMGLVMMANAVYYQDDYPKAEELFTRAVEMGRTLGLERPLARALVDRGQVRTDRADYPAALEDLFDAEEVARRIRDTADLATCLNTIGYVYARTGDRSKARTHYDEALGLRMRQRDERGIAFSLHNLGELALADGRTDDALSLCRRALAIREAMDDTFVIGNSLVLLARVHLSQDSLEQARDEAQRACDIALRIEDLYTLAEGSTQLALALAGLGRAPEARPVAMRAQATARRIGAVELERQAHIAAHRVYRELGEHLAALSALERSNMLADSVHSIENVQRTARIDMEQERRTRELKERITADREEAQERRTTLLRNASVGALVLSLLLAGSVWIGLTRTRRERRRADDLLHNMLPAATVAELKKHGSSKARRHDRATVLFADVAGFSAIAAALEPEDLVHLLNDRFSAYDAIMEKHGVEKIKTIGDAYMAAAGMGDDPTEAANRIVLAALEMQEHNRAQPPLTNGMPFDLRIGIHTGPVVAGVLGTRKLAYDVWGDTVNIAARMESAGEAGRVNISSATFVLVHERFRCTRRGRVEARSIGPVIMYFVEGPVNGTQLSPSA